MILQKIRRGVQVPITSVSRQKPVAGHKAGSNSLTIESGSTVYFSSAANAMVNDGANRMANCLTVNGVIADGVTFTGYEDESWNGIQVLAAENGKTARVTLTGCTFQHAEFPVEVKENAALGDDQSVNVTATNCVFSDPHYLNATGVYSHTVGSGTVSLTGCTFNDYYYGVWVGNNNRADIDINVRGCTFNGTLKQPIRIHSGQSAVVEDCIFKSQEGWRALSQSLRNITRPATPYRQ